MHGGMSAENKLCQLEASVYLCVCLSSITNALHRRTYYEKHKLVTSNGQCRAMFPDTVRLLYIGYETDVMDVLLPFVKLHHQYPT